MVKRELPAEKYFMEPRIVIYACQGYLFSVDNSGVSVLHMTTAHSDSMQNYILQSYGNHDNQFFSNFGIPILSSTCINLKLPQEERH